MNKRMYLDSLITHNRRDPIELVERLQASAGLSLQDACKQLNFTFWGLRNSFRRLSELLEFAVWEGEGISELGLAFLEKYNSLPD